MNDLRGPTASENQSVMISAAMQNEKDEKSERRWELYSRKKEKHSGR
jgi:hypothetical protein